MSEPNIPPNNASTPPALPRIKFAALGAVCGASVGIGLAVITYFAAHDSPWAFVIAFFLGLRGGLGGAALGAVCCAVAPSRAGITATFAVQAGAYMAIGFFLLLKGGHELALWAVLSSAVPLLLAAGVWLSGPKSVK